MYNILWDFDRTIAYRDPMWSGTLLSLLNKNGIHNVSLENIKPHLQAGFTWHNHEYSHKELFKGKNWHEYYESYFYDILIRLGLDKDISKKLSWQVITEYMDKTKWFIYDDVIETLEKLIKKCHENYIISNHIPELNKIVENIGLEKYFKKVFSSGNIGYEKPNINFYKYIFENTDVDKNKCIIIGDSYESDIKGGEYIGIKSILVRKENKNNYKWYCDNVENIILKIEEIMQE
jgi:putative hydrolase of the HAD superfamily